MIIPAHEFEILSCDGNKYEESCIVSASVDKSIRVGDVRNFRIPVAVLNGHGYAVRKVKCSPHRKNMIVSCSYDMTVCMWDYMVEDSLVTSTGWTPERHEFGDGGAMWLVGYVVIGGGVD
ncbi:WD40 repeat [Dillenia turbinata]|uniref:Peroxin-7 n=1 Tax=Dillenia turbinata TaxID=194707 RepID=A0AAN8ZFI4_9MAGN